MHKRRITSRGQGFKDRPIYVSFTPPMPTWKLKFLERPGQAGQSRKGNRSGGEGVVTDSYSSSVETNQRKPRKGIQGRVKRSRIQGTYQSIFMRLLHKSEMETGIDASSLQSLASGYRNGKECRRPKEWFAW